MRIRIGFELAYQCAQPTPMLLMLNVHPSRGADLLSPDRLHTTPSVPQSTYLDAFGNICTRLIAPPGEFRISTDAFVHDSGAPDNVDLEACQHAVEDLPDDTLIHLLGSRYCETDRLSQMAWDLFARTSPGWRRVQAICDYVHQSLTFGYAHARSTRTAAEAHEEKRGVCRDFAHLAITLCRCMNIPARYCTGYLGDIGVPPDPAPMDFSAWFEAYLGGRWHAFDARHNIPRIGRILMGRGRDATDVAISNTFGPNFLSLFRVWTEEMAEEQRREA
ncbi:MAG: transglutaminase family protein [Methylobacteriaceae bacterium]|nr:transglutaminase family protein [Methylobacteriaceae bacterium]MBV9244850.1 transglutaminase family protein [Methylobacteriaceae bacterium]MBV9637597.1 transglutaminase family protein [Methylobacteriaceae bacterium]